MFPCQKKSKVPPWWPRDKAHAGSNRALLQIRIGFFSESSYQFDGSDALETFIIAVKFFHYDLTFFKKRSTWAIARVRCFIICYLNFLKKHNTWAIARVLCFISFNSNFFKNPNVC